SLLDEQYAGEITFLHYARSRADVIFADELETLAQTHSNVRVVTVLTRENLPHTALNGHFSPDHISQLIDNAADRPTWACGPAPLIEAVQTHWHNLGAHDNLQVEYFRPPGNTNQASGGEVRFTHSERLATDTGATLLEQAE